jgi:hypothetical protein
MEIQLSSKMLISRFLDKFVLSLNRKLKRQQNLHLTPTKRIFHQPIQNKDSQMQT